MKNITRSFAACLLTVGIFNLPVVAARAPEQLPPAAVTVKSVSSAPIIVTARKPLSTEQLANYQQQASTSGAAASNNAAGAASNTTVWVVVGVVVVVGVIALASGGGGGGGGY
jgi:hypothetical protein